jgi:hypothetical protein
VRLHEVESLKVIGGSQWILARRFQSKSDVLDDVRLTVNYKHRGGSISPGPGLPAPVSLSTDRQVMALRVWPLGIRYLTGLTRDEASADLKLAIPRLLSAFASRAPAQRDVA